MPALIMKQPSKMAANCPIQRFAQFSQIASFRYLPAIFSLKDIGADQYFAVGSEISATLFG